ncbi:MAG: LysR family transcriptional regulator [Mesorhizobium sp.]
MKNITIKQLRAFVELAHEGSFTRAAGKLNVSQSALTIAIRQLEEEVDLKLFDRTTRSVHLTSQAEMFLPVAERVLHDLSRSLDDLVALAERKKGNVVVAAAASFLCSVVTPAAAKLQKSFPGIRVKLLNAPDKLARRVLEEEIDFGVTNILQAQHGLQSYHLMDDQFGVVCPSDHPLARKTGTLTWQDLKGFTFVSMLPGTQSREIIDRAPEIAHILGDPVCEANSIFALGKMIEEGIGIAAVPAHVAGAILSSDIIYRPIEGPRLKRSIYIIMREGRSLSPAAREVLDVMIEELSAQHSAVVDVKIRHSNVIPQASPRRS